MSEATEVQAPKKTRIRKPKLKSTEQLQKEILALSISDRIELSSFLDAQLAKDKAILGEQLAKLEGR